MKHKKDFVVKDQMLEIAIEQVQASIDILESELDFLPKLVESADFLNSQEFWVRYLNYDNALNMMLDHCMDVFHVYKHSIGIATYDDTYSKFRKLKDTGIYIMYILPETMECIQSYDIPVGFKNPRDSFAELEELDVYLIEHSGENLPDQFTEVCKKYNKVLKSLKDNPEPHPIDSNVFDIVIQMLIKSIENLREKKKHLEEMRGKSYERIYEKTLPILKAYHFPEINLEECLQRFAANPELIMKYKDMNPRETSLVFSNLFGAEISYYPNFTCCFGKIKTCSVELHWQGWRDWAFHWKWANRLFFLCNMDESKAFIVLETNDLEFGDSDNCLYLIRETPDGPTLTLLNSYFTNQTNKISKQEKMDLFEECEFLID